MTQLPDAPEFPSPAIIDSRRLTGPNLYSARPGAVLEVAMALMDDDGLIARWSEAATLLATALEYPHVEVATRRDRNGATLFIAAPVDVLMTATEVNEAAWVAAEQGSLPESAVTSRIREMERVERAQRANMAATYETATTRNINVTFDDERLTLGSGSGARTWPLHEIPHEIPWSDIHDVPIALVTGSNGKTTTTRLVAAMWRAAGRTAGWACSDGVLVGDVTLEKGDYSGPAGARAVLRDARVGAAVLETARGGMLRRGLAVTRADAAIITNISADHFGEYGIESLDDLAAVKSIVAHALRSNGCLVLNADDSILAAHARKLITRKAWFSVTPEHPALDEHVTSGGDAATLHDGHVMLHFGDVWHDLGAVTDMPSTLDGLAAHNVANILGASLLAAELGISVPAIRATLVRFGSSPTDNPGRLQLYHFGAVTVLVDYAHNPDGFRVLCETAATMSAKRRLLIVGQAGNRDDDAIRDLVRSAFAVTAFDHVVVKEMPTMLRGRVTGEISRVLLDELRTLGVDGDAVETAPTEIGAVQQALTWAREGDLVVCPTHIDKAAVLALLARMSATSWRAGQPLPDISSSTS